jgi:tetratricopeptide (TPR) repeat protein
MRKLTFLTTVLFISFAGFGQTAQEYYHKGIEKYAIKNYQGAIADFDHAIKKDPKFVDAYIKRGLAKRGMLDKAENKIRTKR